MYCMYDLQNVWKWGWCMSKAVNFPHYKAYTLYTLSNNGAQFVIYCPYNLWHLHFEQDQLETTLSKESLFHRNCFLFDVPIQLPLNITFSSLITINIYVYFYYKKNKNVFIHKILFICVWYFLLDQLRTGSFGHNIMYSK